MCIFALLIGVMINLVTKGTLPKYLKSSRVKILAIMHIRGRMSQRGDDVTPHVSIKCMTKFKSMKLL